MIIKRLSLVYPVITYRAKMKRNLGFVVNEDWIIGQLYTDTVGNKYLLAGTPENEDQQRFYEVTNLRQETVGILSPFKTTHESAIFDGDIVSITAYNGIKEESSIQMETGLDGETVMTEKERSKTIPDNAEITFSKSGIVKNYNGNYFFEYSDSEKVSLGAAVVPLYQFFSPDFSPLENHIIEVVGNIYDNPQLAQQILYRQ